MKINFKILKILSNTPLKCKCSRSPQSAGSERGAQLPRVTQLVICKAKMQSQVRVMPKATPLDDF